jgi:hypothetical protein
VEYSVIGITGNLVLDQQEVPADTQKEILLKTGFYIINCTGRSGMFSQKVCIMN